MMLCISPPSSWASVCLCSPLSGGSPIHRSTTTFPQRHCGVQRAHPCVFRIRVILAHCTTQLLSRVCVTTVSMYPGAFQQIHNGFSSSGGIQAGGLYIWCEIMPLGGVTLNGRSGQREIFQRPIRKYPRCTPVHDTIKNWLYFYILEFR